MKIRNNKGFTLIELLAVIVIMGILLMVAIPAVSRIIENSRKDSLVTIAKEYVNAVRNSWASDSLLCGSEDKVSSSMDEGNYYVLIDTTSETTEELLDQGGKSPWGNRDLKGYVRVNITTNAKEQRITKYYIAIADGTHGIYDNVSSPIEADDLARGDVIMNLDNDENNEKKKSIMTTPFENGKVTTCSVGHGNWDGSGSSGGSVETVSFAEDSWDTIVSAVQAGSTENYHVGDTKEVDMGTFGTHTIRVANTSTPAECSTAGFSQTACGFVLEFADIITKHNMNSSSTDYPYGDNIGGWPASEMYTYVQNDIYNALPSELKAGIIDTYVVSGHGSSESTNFASTDKLYLLSPKEVLGSNRENDTATAETRQLDYYKEKGVTTSNYSGAIKRYNGSNSYWWLRAALSNTSNRFYIVFTTGDWSHAIASYTYGVAPAFRIG